MTPAQIAQIDAKARALYTYVPDPTAHNTWVSYAAAVLANRQWSGNCDDRAHTTLDLLARAGLPLADEFRLEVSTTHDGVINHMVGGVYADDGSIWVVGDTFLDKPYPAAEMQHQGIQYNRMSETLPEPTWRGGVPWQIAA